MVQAVATAPTSVSTILPTTSATSRPAIIVDGFDDRLNVTLPTNSDETDTWQYGVVGSEYRIAKVDPDADIVVTSFIPGFFADATMSIDTRMIGPIDGRFISIGCRGRRCNSLLG